MDIIASLLTATSTGDDRKDRIQAYVRWNNSNDAEAEEIMRNLRKILGMSHKEIMAAAANNP